MPKAKKKETPHELAQRFHADIERLAAAGALRPTETEKVLDRIANSFGNHSSK